MNDDKKGRSRGDIAIVAGLLTALAIAAVVLILLPGKKTDAPPSTPSTSASTVAAVTATAPPAPASTKIVEVAPAPSTSSSTPQPIAVGDVANIVPPAPSNKKVLTKTTDMPDPEFALDVKDLRGDIEKLTPKLKDKCFSLVPAGAPSLVTLVLHLQEDGWLSAVDIDTSSNDALAACVQGAAKKWKFPSTSTGGVVRVPLTFTR